MESSDEMDEDLTKGLYGHEVPYIKTKGVEGLKGHKFGITCCPSLINFILQNHFTMIPDKCGVPGCEGKIKFEFLEGFMSEEQKLKYKGYVEEIGLAKTKKRVCCPHPDGGASQYWKKDSKEFLFYCANKLGLRTSGLVCNKQFKSPKDKNNLTAEEKKLKESEDWIDSHIERCGKYAEQKMRIAEILRDGNVRCCPLKGSPGMRKIVDEGNHITGDIGGTEFGYFGGKSLEEGDKNPPGTSMYHHFDSWDTNPKRCPKFFYQINRVDKSWPTSDEKGQEKLHKIIIFTDLREYISHIGKDVFDEILAKFPDIKEGFDLTELFTMDLTYIQRKTS